MWYKHIFKDLTLIHRSAPDEILIRPNNIGGGFGNDGGQIYVINCTMVSNSDICSDYHSSWKGNQNDSCDAYFNNCTLNRPITATSIGNSSDYKNTIYVSNCIIFDNEIKDSNTINACLISNDNRVLRSKLK